MNASRSRPSPWWYAKGVLGLALIAAAVVSAARSSLVPSQALRSAAVVLVVAGGLCELYHYALLKRSAGNVADPRRLRKRGGLYRWVRHPMYLGDALLYAGFVLLAPSIATAAIASLAMLALVMLARTEDAQMAARFGAAHANWRARSRLLFPWPRRIP